MTRNKLHHSLLGQKNTEFNKIINFHLLKLDVSPSSAIDNNKERKENYFYQQSQLKIKMN